MHGGRQPPVEDHQAAQASLPAGTPGSVTIFRDQWGVAHVYAAREADGFFGAGYALADDDLDAILRAYLEVTGRSAAAFGRSSVPSDSAAALWGAAVDARRGFNELSPQIRADDTAFIQGIRRYMRDNPGRVPAWAPELEDWMPLAVSHALATLISVYQSREGLSDCHLPPGELPVPFLGQHESTALWARPNHSNEWVLAPRLARAHGTVVWADSHSEFSWSRDEITIHAGSMNVAGIVVAGMALPLIGHNESVAWAFTSGGPDVADCYRIAVSPGDPPRYRYDGRWRHLVERRVTIFAKGSSPTIARLEYFEQNGRLNPVVANYNGAAYAISTAYAGSRAAIAMEQQVYGMDRAANMAGFIAANRYMGLFPENVMAGDRFGSTYYVSIGRVPRRDQTIDWSRPVSGNTSRTEWLGMTPFDRLIQLASPTTGWMQNNNVAPDTMFPGSEIRAAAYPRYLFNDDPGRTDDRGERAKELLSHAHDVDIAQAIAMGMDEYWLHTPQWQKALRAAADDTKLPQGQQALVNDLLGFNGVAKSSSPTALQWYLWCEAVGNVAHERGTSESAIASKVHDGQRLSPAEDAVLRDALAVALESIQRVGGLDRSLGDVAKIGRGSTVLPTGGVTLDSGIPDAVAEDTIRGIACKWSSDRRTCLAVFGQRHPMLTVFSSPLQAFSAVPFGESSNPESPHFSDQSALESQRRLKPDYFEWTQLRAHISSELTLSVRQP